MTTFKELGLSKTFIEILAKYDIVTPTEIQKMALPLAMQGIDIIGTSSTGSGKTLAFAAPIIKHSKTSEGISALILVPTRELAEQVATAFRKFSKRKLKIFSAYGGVDIKEHVRKVKKADVVVATPGRLLDLLNRSAIDLSKIKTLVLDEFDRMLDMGFVPDVETIVKKCSKKRHTMLFSATKSSKIDKIVKSYVNKAKRISVKPHVESSKLKQSYYDTKNNSKFSLLIHLLNHKTPESALIFCSTRINTDFVGNNLGALGFNVKIIHGGLEQKKRTRRLKEFHKEGGLLVCTDVAARGLDIQNVSHVYNYELPRTADDYIHRIGRTARAGKEGKAISLISTKEKPVLAEILKIKGIELQEMETPNVEKISMKTALRRKRASQNKNKKAPKRTGQKWFCINDPDLSNRERKRSVNKKDEDYVDAINKKRKRTRTSKSKRTGRSGTRSTSRTDSKTGGRVRKKSTRPKGRSNRKTRK